MEKSTAFVLLEIQQLASKDDSNVQCSPKVTEARRNILAYAPSEQISGTAGV